MPPGPEVGGDPTSPDQRWSEEPGAARSNLTSRTLGAFKWTYGSYGASAVVQVGYTAAMARLLAPEDFGLVAMASLFLRFGGHFAQMGVGQALIQKASLTRGEIRTGFTASVALGAAMSAAFLVGAPLAELVFDSPRVVAIARVLALSFLLQGLGVTAESLLRRQLRFRALAVVEVAASTIGYMGVGIAFALAGAGVWSLVAAGLAQAAMTSVIAMALVRHPMHPLVAWPELRVLYSFGGRVSVISFFEFLGTSLDTLFIGRYAGEAPLGQYNRARLLVELPLFRVTQGTAKVLFPAFSRIQDKPERLRGAYLSGLRLISLLVVPAAAGMAVAARELQLVVLGPQWEDAAAVLPYLALLVAFTLTSKMAAILCEAVAALNAKLVLTLGHVALLSALLWSSIGGGLEAYALAIAAAGGARFLAYTALMRRVLQVGWRDHLEVLGPILLTAAATAGVVAAVSGALRPVLPVGAVLAAQVATGATVLALALLVGPLGGVRRDLHRRLRGAGLLQGGGRAARTADRVLRGGR